MNPLLAAALAYARAGWPVFPLQYVVMHDGRLWCSCGSPECSSSSNAAKHPYGMRVPRGFRDATLDTRKIERWWAGTAYNIGDADR